MHITLNKLISIKLWPVLAAAFLSVVLLQCKKNEVNDKTFTVSGIVTDETGSAVSGATVILGGQTTTTGGDGRFSFSGLPDMASYQVEASATNYFTGYKNVDNIDGSSLETEISLMAKNNLGTLPAGGGSVGSTGLRVTAAPGAFSNADGSPYAGQVKVAARYIRQDNPSLASLMPGGDFMAREGNDVGAMISYGFVATEFTDAAGKKLVANANVKAAVTVPAGAGNPVTNGAKAWSYDPVSGKWNNSTGITQTGSEYFFPVTTLYQNIDRFVLGFGTIEGQVKCTNGSPVAGVKVTLASTQYNNKYITYTNANGKYRAKVAVKDGNITFNYNVSTTSSTVYAGTAPVGGTVTAPVITTTNCTGSGGGGGGGTGSGNYTAGGVYRSGVCTSVPDVVTGGPLGNIDVAIITSNGESFIIYNMPQQSSGSYAFNDGYNSSGGSVLYGLMSQSSNVYGTRSGGTVTKTGAKSFTFSCTVYDIITNQNISVTGSGNY